jgi:hypothetical protein
MTAVWGVLFAIFALWGLLMAALTWWGGKREASSGAASSHRRIREVDQQFAAEVVSAALSSAPRAPLRLADVLASINDYNIQNLGELVPWNWKIRSDKLAA